MKGKIIFRGAEAVITKYGIKVFKTRLRKSYRHPLLDEMLRKSRTKREGKNLEKAGVLIPVPKLYNTNLDKKELQLDFISGEKLSDCLEKLPFKKICLRIGKQTALLHNQGIIHGDLTTSNMIWDNKKLFFIDFGLSFHSNRFEDKAVDLHLIKEALEARHHLIFKEAFKNIIIGYKKIAINSELILKRLQRVQKRGRYKSSY